MKEENECTKLLQIIQSMISKSNQENIKFQQLVYEIPENIHPQVYQQCHLFSHFQKSLSQQNIQYNFYNQGWSKDSLFIQYLSIPKKLDITH